MSDELRGNALLWLLFFLAVGAVAIALVMGGYV
jgi:hypothetical protein